MVVPVGSKNAPNKSGYKMSYAHRSCKHFLQRTTNKTATEPKKGFIRIKLSFTTNPTPRSTPQFKLIR
jgi:hypothetical protein